MSAFTSPDFFVPATVDKIFNKYSTVLNVPIFQRLYSWSQKEILQLLEDIKVAFEKGAKYYVGILLLNYNTVENCYDIIDGQQRITTLWLIGLVMQFTSAFKEWSSFLNRDGNILIKFIGREEDNLLLAYLLERGPNSVANLTLEKVNPVIIDAIKTINIFLYESIEIGQLEKFSKYIFENTNLAAVYLSSDIDMNKYFEDMNNRGLQLEPPYIVKAKLLANIDENLHQSYAEIWDAVSQMNQYIEYGLNGDLKITLYDLKNAPHKFFSKKSTSESKNARTLFELIKESKALEFTENSRSKTQPPFEKDKVNSIVNFSEFLLHCLRLFNSNYSIPVDDKKLTENFDKHFNFEKSKDFIESLFKIRIEFDNKFIKSINSSQGTRWEINEIVQYGECNREVTKNDYITQLQSMLTVSTASSVWLTKSLAFVLSLNYNDKNFLNYLEQIDWENHRSLPDEDELNRGVLTNRYWFYKLDYLLWKKWTTQTDIPSIKGIANIKSKIENYQFRENRSVEHIHPQHPFIEIWNERDEKSLRDTKDMYGNLALISISSNSSYSHQTFANKKMDFIKKTMNWGIESLKLVDIYSTDNWSEEDMYIHHRKMISLLQEHYNTSIKRYAQPN